MISETVSLADQPVIDLRYVAFEHTCRGVLVLGTWFMDAETRQAEPCMVLLDAKRQVRRGKTIPCIIPLNQAWRWTRELGDPIHVAKTIADWIRCGALPGSLTDQAAFHAVMDAIQSRLRDLLLMPPLPVSAAIKHGAAPALGDLVITERTSGMIVHEAEVTGHVRH